MNSMGWTEQYTVFGGRWQEQKPDDGAVMMRVHGKGMIRQDCNCKWTIAILWETV